MPYFSFLSSVANCIAIVSGLISRLFAGCFVDSNNTGRRLYELSFVCSQHSKTNRILVNSFSHFIFPCSLLLYKPNLVYAPLRCYGVTPTCRFVTDALFALRSIFIRLVLMLVFKLLTIRNLRQSRNSLQPNTIVSTEERSRKAFSGSDYRLLIILLTWAFLMFLFGLSSDLQRLYATITTNHPTSKTQVTSNNSAYSLAQLLNFFAKGVPFYVVICFIWWRSLFPWLNER